MQIQPQMAKMWTLPHLVQIRQPEFWDIQIIGKSGTVWKLCFAGFKRIYIRENLLRDGRVSLLSQKFTRVNGTWYTNPDITSVVGLHAVPVTGTAIVSTGPERERSVTRRRSFCLLKLTKHASQKAYTAYSTAYSVFSGPVDLSTAVFDGNGHQKCSERAHGTGRLSKTNKGGGKRDTDQPKPSTATRLWASDLQAEDPIKHFGVAKAC
ncbi:hypothetical protein DFH08DRAFT_801918 [Mycena albidolilacea]|uniref:Uncharacterized protein n=1 Tax=Mycena albidolilacea TaxID=1033008 RepID=A0AAD7AHK2_9AGAR|nr:hypothetical protein DFH08DRAFT_801918 [Mycena albidolilacea]